MAITLLNLKNRTSVVPLVLDEETTLNITYKPNEITPGYLDGLVKETDLLALARAVAVFVKDWDITNEDGSAYPVTVDNAANLGIKLLNDIVEAVSGDMRPLDAKRNGRR